MIPSLKIAAVLVALTPNQGPFPAEPSYAHSQLRHDAGPPQAQSELVGLRRACRLGLRWSTYHRKCVLWLPPASG